MTSKPDQAWTGTLLGQLEFYWDHHLRPRLEGLTDEEFRWEPVEGAWTLRQGPDGGFVPDHLEPEPPTPPITTIAWRMEHLSVLVLGTRAGAFFGEQSPPDAGMYDRRNWPDPMPGTATAAIDYLTRAYTAWHDGVAALDDDGLAAKLGPKGGPYAESSMAELVLHIGREVMAHGAEICLLRDLFRAQRLRSNPFVAACLGGDATTAARLRDDDRSAVERARQEHPDLVRQVVGLRHWNVVRVLLDNGFDPNTGSPTSLHYAAAAGARETVDLLLDKGADPHATDPQFGYTPEGWAEFFGHPDLAGHLKGS